MKILFLAHANSIHSHRWIRFFANAGHTIIWVSLTAPLKTDVITHSSVRFIFLDKTIFRIPLIGSLAVVVVLKKLLAQEKPDILHVHYVGINGALASFCNFHPMVVTAWGSDVLFAGKSFWKRPLVARALRNADLVTCDAEHMREAIIRFKVPSPRIHIIQFGIDTKRFMPGQKKQELLEKLGLSGNKTVISLRTFEPVYDISSLIRAVPLVLKKHPDVHILLVGSGPEEKMLRELVEDLHISNHVTFLGFIQNNELPDYLRSVDVYVSTSLSDAGIASSTAEAMACGTPIVVTDSGENRSWINNGENGYLVPTKNPDALAEKIILLLSDSDLRKIVGAAGRKTIQERDDYYREMEKMSELYTTLHKN